MATFKKLSKAAFAALTPGKKAAYTKQVNARNAENGVAPVKQAAPKKAVKPLKVVATAPVKKAKANSTGEY